MPDNIYSAEEHNALKMKKSFGGGLSDAEEERLKELQKQKALEEAVSGKIR